MTTQDITLLKITRRGNLTSKIKDSKKKKRHCFNCGKSKDIKRNCCPLKKKKRDQDGNSNFIAMINEAFVMEFANKWWLDSGSIRYVCNMNLLKMTKFVTLSRKKGTSSMSSLPGKPLLFPICIQKSS